MRRAPHGTFWPTRLQRQLLVAALAGPEEFIAAWRRLRPELVLDVLEPGSFELMPLIYRQLVNSEVEDTILTRLKGIYRKSWLIHTLLLERTRESASALDAAGVRALFVEGAPLAARYYPEPGLRFTSYVDLLVDEDVLPQATAALASARWYARPDVHVGSGGRHHLFDRDSHACVVRPTLAVDFLVPHDRDRAHALLWQGAEHEEVNGVSILVPQPTDALLAVCVSGARKLPVPSIQWIVDAAMIVRAHDIDWERLAEIAGATGQAGRLRDSLSYLATLPGTAPPAGAIERLDAIRMTRRARLAQLFASGSVRGLGAMPSIVSEHLAATADDSSVRTVATFPRHLRRSWNVDHSWQLPLAAGRRAIKVLRGSDGRA